MKRIILTMVCAVWATAYINAQVNNEIVTTASPAITTGDDNTGIGASVFTTLSTGSRNTFIGNTAGDGAVTNDDNTYVGYGATGSNGLNEAAAIGAGATVTASNTLILGRANDASSILPNVNVGIGVTSSPAKLTVFNGPNPAILGAPSLGLVETFNCSSADFTFNFGDIASASISQASSSSNVGSVSLGADGANYNAGIVAMGGGGNTFNIGAFGNASGGAGRNWGVWGDVIADDGALNIGVAGIVDDNCGGNPGTNGSNYGIYGSCDPFGSAPSGSTTNWAGYFNGHVAGVSFYNISDAKFKENVTPLESSLDKINSLKFYSYTFNNKDYPQMNFGSKLHFGVLAQEVEKVFPNLIANTRQHATKDKGKEYDVFDYKAVNYTELIPITMQAVQELDAKIEALNALLAKNGIDVSKLDDGTRGGGRKDAYLEQNAPNPTSGETVIRYFAPESVSKVMLVIMGVNGEVVMKDATLATGKQEFKIKTGDLKEGVYFYSLFCDNELVATKKMILVGK